VTPLSYGTVHPFMLWNLYLATFPAALAMVLFRKPERTGVTWCAGFVVWLLFLPNSPYVLTDVVHMVDEMRVSTTHTHAYAVLATYAVFFTCGLASYVVSLQLFRRFLCRVSPHRLVLPILLVVHSLCIVAMYLGRFMRLNSWDVLLAPRTVLGSVVRVPHPFTLVVLATMFVVVGVGTCIAAALGDKVIAELRRLRTR
jgi:uncharacterized membrane protein